MQAKIPTVGLEKGRNYALDLTDLALIFFLNDQVIVRRVDHAIGELLKRKSEATNLAFLPFSKT